MDTRHFRQPFVFFIFFMIWGVLTPSYQMSASDRCDEIVDKIGHGGVLWTEKAIIVQGTAAPDLSDPNRSLHIIKERAKRAATIDAYRKAAGVLAGIRLTSDLLARDNPRVISKISAYVRKSTVCKSKFYADGGVDVVVKVPISGIFAADQFKDAGTDPATGKSEFTGLIVDASHLIFAPALVPRLLKTDGSVLFNAAKVRKDVVLEGAAVHYAENSGTIDYRIVGANPLRAMAIRLSVVSPSDLIIDSNAARILDGSPGFISAYMLRWIEVCLCRFTKAR